MILTRFTEMFSLRHPIALAPMGRVAGGRLGAELSRVRKETRRPWGVGLITWSVDRGIVERVLEFRPYAVMLSFGDPRPYAGLVKSAGCKLICQVQDLEGARLAKEALADVIVGRRAHAGASGRRHRGRPRARGRDVLAAQSGSSSARDINILNTALASQFQGHHKEHADVLAKTIRQLGGKPLEAKRKYEFAVSALKSQADVLRFAASLEKGAVSAYLGAVPLFGNRDLSRAAASILGDEAMHWAVLRNALGDNPVPAAFVS